MQDVHVANSIIRACFLQDIEVRPMKLQKLLYYVVGFFYSLKDEYLLNDDFHKWDYGPVVPDIYRKFMHYKHKPIKRVYIENGKAFEIVNYKGFNAIRDKVLYHYGEYGDLVLSRLTHNHSAWRDAKLYRPMQKEAIKNTFDKIGDFGYDKIF